MPREALSLVMPVYNEEACIASVVKSWCAAFEALGIDFSMIVLNDGSKDGTAQALRAFEGDSRVVVVQKPNSGHGPTILQGYKLAAERAEWVFQTDSDGEMEPEHFSRLWNEREKYDFLLGTRDQRVSPLPRRIITQVSRLTVWLMFGRGITDVNSPYRLIRAEYLKKILEGIAPDTFAPNVVISGLAARRKLRIFEYPVPHLHRRTGTVSIVKWKLWKSAMRSFFQTLAAALKG
jgi:dolichol-phosphate mannosyltransferase